MFGVSYIPFCLVYKMKTTAFQGWNFWPIWKKLLAYYEILTSASTQIAILFISVHFYAHFVLHLSTEKKTRTKIKHLLSLRGKQLCWKKTTKANCKTLFQFFQLFLIKNGQETNTTGWHLKTASSSIWYLMTWTSSCFLTLGLTKDDDHYINLTL